MKKYLSMISGTPLFEGISEREIEVMLKCLSSEKKTYSKDAFIFRAGDTISSMGMVLSGSILLFQEDVWGRRNIMARIGSGEVFAETFAASSDMRLTVSAIAKEPCELLFLNVRRILKPCSSGCEYHSRVIRNLVSVLADKNLKFNEKITHMSRKTTRDKLLSYLSARSFAEKNLEFDIPFDRQQLADYLCVERAAMSVELGKLKKSGLIRYHKNHFVLSPDIPVE